LFFVSVAAKGLRASVSLLESTLVGGHVSVASKEVVCAKMVQNAVCFVTVANRGLRPKSRLQKAKTPAGMLAFPGSGVILPNQYCTLGFTFSQGKKMGVGAAAKGRGKSQNPLECREKFFNSD
jgi:hypothetical protein